MHAGTYVYIYFFSKIKELYIYFVFQFRAYTFKDGKRGPVLPFKFCDTMGLEEGGGFDTADVPYLLDGNIPDMHQVYYLFYRLCTFI